MRSADTESHAVRRRHRNTIRILAVAVLVAALAAFGPVRHTPSGDASIRVGAVADVRDGAASVLGFVRMGARLAWSGHTWSAAPWAGSTWSRSAQTAGRGR